MGQENFKICIGPWAKAQNQIPTNRQLGHHPFFPALMVINNNETCLKFKTWNIIPLFQITKLNSLMGRELTSHYINCHSASNSSYKTKLPIQWSSILYTPGKMLRPIRSAPNKQKLFHTCPSHYNGHSKSALML
jgi:hypothetical protein